MFERYNEEARRSIFFARYEASQFGAPCIEAEHLLLGLMRQMNLPGDEIRAEIMQVSAHATPTSTSVDLPVSLAVKRTMAFAAEEATKLGHAHIGPEHLLLGLMVDQPDSIVPALLRKHGIDRAKALSSISDTAADAPVDRDSLKALVDTIPEQRLRHAKQMLEHMQIVRPLPSPPPVGEEGGWLGGGSGWNFARPGTRGTPPGRMRQGRRSFSRMEHGSEVVETHHLRDGCEITLIERFRLSEDGKILSYTQEVTGPGKSEQHTIDFEVSQEGGKNPPIKTSNKGTVLMVVVEQTERELVEACRHGEPDAFRALFERYKDKVYSVALRYSGDPAIAQDISQDTFLKLFSVIGSFRGDSGFESWLYRLVVNRCFDQKRGARRLMPLLDEFLGALHSPDCNALEDVLRSEASAQVGSVVASLPPEQRIVIVLRYTQGLSYEEIAGILGCSTGTIGSRLNRAHRVIARRLAHVAGAGRRKV